MRKGYIYKLTTPDGKIYIGKTKSLKRRFNKYKNCRDHGLMYIEIEKWGWDNIEKEFLYESEYNEELFSELEKHFIRIYNTFDSPKGLNSQSGGKRGFKTSKIALKNISSSHIGYVQTEEARKKRSKSMTGKRWKIKDTSNMGKIVFDTENGIYYNNISEAAFLLNIKRTTLNAKLCGQNINNTNLIYV